MNRSANIRVRILVSACVWLSGAFANAQPPALKQGDDGAAVERLQRLLNARLDPSPELDVDGDFGAATLAALRRFQRQEGLPATGAADPETWEALGALAPAEEAPAPGSRPRRPGPSPTARPAACCSATRPTSPGTWPAPPR